MTSLQPLFGFLTVAMTDTSSTVVVDDPSLLTGTDQIAILAPNAQRVEIMTVTGGAGTALSPWIVSRAQRGTTATAHAKGAKVQGVNFRLTIGSGGSLQDYTMRWNNLTEEDVTPGGHGSLEFKRFVPEPVVLPSMGDAVVLSRSTSATPGVWTDKTIYTGLIEEPGAHYYPTGGAELHPVATGYSQHLSDRMYEESKILDPTTAIPAGLTTARIIVQGLGDLCPLIASDYSHIVAGGQGIQYATGDLLGKNTLQLITEYTPIGDAFVPSQWAVRGFGTTSPTFELIPRPTGFRYRINIEDTIDGVTITPRRSDVYTTVLVRWHGGVVPADNPAALASIHNVERMILIDASSFIADSDTARSYAKTLATLLGQFRPKIGEAKMYFTKPIYDYDLAGNVEPWDVVSGQVLDIYKGGSRLSSGNDNLSFAGGFYVRSVRRDYQAGTITFATNDQESEIARMISRVALTELTRQDSPTKMVTGPQWTAPDSPTYPIPSPVPPTQRLAKGQDDRLDYADAPNGADTGSLALTWTGGGGTDTPTAIAVGEGCSYDVHTPMYLHTVAARVTPVDSAQSEVHVEIDLYRVPTSVSVDADGTFVTSPSAPVLLDTIVLNAASTTATGAGDLRTFSLTNLVVWKPAKKLNQDDAIMGRVTVNESGKDVREISVTIRPQKLAGQSAKPVDTSPPGIVSLQAQRGAPTALSPTPSSLGTLGQQPQIGATFTLTTSKPCRAQIRYGTSLSASGGALPMGWSSFSPLGTTHVLTIPPIPLSMIVYDVLLSDERNVTTTDAGHILY